MNIRKRPQRVAFTVDFRNSSLADIVSIIKYNQGKWGGRNNPIIHCDGKTLDKVWWDFLDRYDADALKTFIDLNEDLIDEMNMRLTPYLMEFNDINTGYNEHINITNRGYSILPTPENVARAYGGPRDRATLVLFDIEEAEDELVRNFITVNFGTYAPLEYIENQLKLSKVQRLKVTDIASLIEAMQKIATYGSFVFPIQICAISPESRYQSLYRDDMFTVVIGNSITDVIHTWNRGIARNTGTGSVSHAFQTRVDDKPVIRAIWRIVVPSIAFITCKISSCFSFISL